MAAEIPTFEVGGHYVAIAKKMVDPRARQGAGLGGTDTVAFTPVACSDSLSLSPDIVRELGPGESPK